MEHGDTPGEGNDQKTLNDTAHRQAEVQGLMRNGNMAEMERDEQTKTSCSLDEPDVWRWFIVAGVFVTSFIFGMERTMSTYYLELMEYFETDSSVTSLIGSIFYSFFCFTGIVASPISDKYGSRIVIMIGGVLVAIGLMASAFAPNIYVCVVAFGFFVGAGFAMSFLTMMITTLYYFKKKSLLAQGIGISGVGIGGIVLPIVVEYLNARYSWRGGLTILSGLALNICVCGALVRPLGKRNKSKENVTICSTESTRSGSKNVLKALYELLCIKPFVMLCFQHIFLQASVSILMIHMKATVESLSGVSGEAASYVMSYYCAMLLVGITLTATFVHFTGSQPLYIQQLMYFLGGVAMTLVPVFPSFPTMTAFFCVHGLGLSTNLNLVPLILYEFVGESKLRLGFAVQYIFSGAGGLLGPLIAGLLYDRTKNYANSMYLGGGGLALSILFMIVPCINVMRSQKGLKGRTEEIFEAEGERAEKGSLCEAE